jgi:hypothetical protein
MSFRPSVTTITSNTEASDGINYTSKFTLASFSLGNCADNASLAIGNSLGLFFPQTGVFAVKRVSINLGLTAAISNTAQTPVVGLGTVIGSGAVADLTGTATFQSYFVGTAVADLTGTRLVKSLVPTTPEILTGGVHTVFLNAAAAWADIAAVAPVLATGTIVFEWTVL